MGRVVVPCIGICARDPTMDRKAQVTMTAPRVAAAVLVGGVLVGGMGATPVMADAELSRVTHSAIQCQQSGTETGAFDRSPFRITRTAATGSGNLICPVPFNMSQAVTAVKDSQGKWGSFKWVRATKVQVWIVFNDNNDTGNMYFQLSRRSLDGTVLVHSDASTAGLFGTTMLMLEVPLDLTGFHLSDILTLECQMPVNAGVRVTKLFSYDVITTTSQVSCDPVSDLNHCTQN
jgi:hypothetical protein